MTRIVFEKTTASYVHLQDAYFAEKNELGKASDIAYTTPPNNVFTYDAETTAGKFEATATGLGDCTSGTWTVDGTGTAAGASTVSYSVSVDGDGCEVLTPNFTKIGAGTAAAANP